jgi:hypothetical protein
MNKNDGFFDDSWKRTGPKINLKYDRSGEKINSWQILEFVGPKIQMYRVRCGCGREYIRNVYAILSYSVKHCYVCEKKRGVFKDHF